jgi:hypothetical protein
MLTNASRIYESAWAAYSFLFFSNIECRVVFHSDGSLTHTHRAFLERMFPGCDVIDVAQADAIVSAIFDKRHLHRCQRLRNSLVFAKKLFDVCLLEENSRIILLDNDVLFYRKPDDLLAASLEDIHVYQKDFQRNYCLSEEALQAVRGANLPAQLNPGIMSINLPKIDFSVAEKALQQDGFFDQSGRADYFSELTLWAILISQSANRPLPECYWFNVGPWHGDQIVAGHFCGGSWWTATYYYQGLPEVWQRITGSKRSLTK